MSAHGKQGYQHWNTPESVLAPIRAFRPIDLDPCSNATSTVGAQAALTALDNGLGYMWRMWHHTFVNPPYGRGEQARWLAKAAFERANGAAHITALIPAAVETLNWREHVWPSATAVAFWRTRIKFERHDGVADAGNKLPSALVYWGCDMDGFAAVMRPHATVVTAWVGSPC